MILKYDFAPEALENKTPLNLVANLDQLELMFPDLDAIVLTSKDPFISEYVPLINSPRYGVTGFTGSVGDAVYFSKRLRTAVPGLKPVALFVDGRYHLQADRETDPKWVEAVKLDVEPNIESGVHKMLFERKDFQGRALKIGIDYERTSVAAMTRYQEAAKKAGASLYHFKGETVLEALRLRGWVTDRVIFGLPESATGRTIGKTLSALSQDLEKTFGTNEVIHVTAATDDAAFLLNARGYHLPHTASFMAYTFFYKHELIVYLPHGSRSCKVELDSGTFGDFAITVIRDSEKELEMKLKAMVKDQLRVIAFNGGWMNALLPSRLAKIFPKAVIKPDYKWVLQTRARKSPQEMESIRKAFLHSSRAIAKTLRWGKAESQKRKLSEVDLAEYLYQSYADEGAVALSFKTISGAGPNSAIVHYSTPSKTQYFESGHLALLDSGAYYTSGFCTDCTRGFFVGGGEGMSVKPAAWQRDIYTTTLKSAIQVFLRPVDGHLSGKDVDAMIRFKVKEAGYDYMHGTGHGIGIHVHEDGIRLSTLSTYPQSVNACVSVEPGIYLKDQGGVRVENVALLQPEGKNFRYENVVFVGYDWDLVDTAKLTGEEKLYLKAYEAICADLGTTLTACPL